MFVATSLLAVLSTTYAYKTQLAPPSNLKEKAENPTIAIAINNLLIAMLFLELNHRKFDTSLIVLYPH